MTLLSALIVAGVVAWGAKSIVAALNAAHAEARAQRTLDVIRLFAPAVDAAAADPRAMLTWEPIARTARQLFAAEFAEIDRASAETFPFGASRIQAAHAQWTADWLAWERAHDATYKLKAADAEAALQEAADPTLARARLDSIEREKLELYQRKYQEYVQVGKALHALIPRA